MKQRIGGTHKVSVNVTRMERKEHENGAVSYTSVPNGTKTALVELWIDAKQLLNDLGDRAVRSKGKKSRIASGAIEVRVVSKVTHTFEGEVRVKQDS